MTPLDSIILGIIEGFTEFLPISSTAHLILGSQLLGLNQSAFVKSFEIAIQSGAIVAVLVLYWRKFLNIEILKRIITAFIPTAIIGLAFYSIIKKYFIGNMSIVLSALLIGGIGLIVFEYWNKKRVATLDSTVQGSSESSLITYKQSLIIGLVQSIAIIPGVSRSAATIIGGMLLGLSRAAIVEFSFLLAVPTIGAATALDLLKNYHTFTIHDAGVLSIGFITSFITAIIGIKFLLSFVRTKTFIGFGVYRIVVAIAFFLMIYF